MSTKHSASGVNSLAAFDNAGALSGLEVFNNSAGTLYLMIFDRDAAGSPPANGQTPEFPPIPIAAGVYYESTKRREFLLGCYLVMSTTAGTVTIDTGGTTRISADVG